MQSQANAIADVMESACIILALFSFGMASSYFSALGYIFQLLHCVPVSSIGCVE